MEGKKNFGNEVGGWGEGKVRGRASVHSLVLERESLVSKQVR